MPDLSTLLGIIGIVISLWAASTALDVKKTVEKMVRRSNAQTDTDTIRSVLDAVEDAKNAAKNRQGNAPALRTRGRKLADDIGLLVDAEDSLRTGMPPAVPPTLISVSVSTADDVRVALQEINTGNTQRDGWADALAALSTVIPELEREHRRLKNETLALG